MLKIPDDSIYRIAPSQWLDWLLKEKSYNDTMRWILLRWPDIYTYMELDGKLTDDGFITPTESLIARFTGKSRWSVGTALQRLHQGECIYKKPGTSILLSDGKPTSLIFLKAYTSVWYGQFKPIEKAEWGGTRDKGICETCGGKVVHVTLEHDICKECGTVTNETVSIKEYE